MHDVESFMGKSQTCSHYVQVCITLIKSLFTCKFMDTMRLSNHKPQQSPLKIIVRGICTDVNVH